MNKQIVNVVIGVIKFKDKYLLTKRIHSDIRFHDKWQFPGGALEFGEDFEQALKREIMEETNIEIKNVRFIPKLKTTIRDNWQGVFICYICEPISENFNIILDEEASEYKWLSLNEIRKLDTLQHTIEIAQEADNLFLSGAGRGT